MAVLLHRTVVEDARVATGARLEDFESIYRLHYRDVYRYVLLMLRNHEDAEDVVSETFQRALRGGTSRLPPHEKPLPWLLVIARRIAIDRLRRRKLIRWVPFTSKADRPEPSDRSERAEFWMWLDALARVLPERQREVIFLRYQRDLSDEDIGKILGLTPSGVRSLLARALETLRRHPELLS